MQRRCSGGSHPADEQANAVCNSSACPWAPHPPYKRFCKGKSLKSASLLSTNAPGFANKNTKHAWSNAKLLFCPGSPPKPCRAPTETTQRCKIRLRSHLLPSSRGAKGHGEPAKCADRALPAPWLLQSARLFLQSLLAGQGEQGGTCEAGWLPSKEKQMQIFLHFSLGAAWG